VTGDARDEIILWDQERVWIYTQDRPFTGQKLYAPQRAPIYNESNYRAQVVDSGVENRREKPESVQKSSGLNPSVR
jgi:hypothetical protein